MGFESGYTYKWADLYTGCFEHHFSIDFLPNGFLAIELKHPELTKILYSDNGEEFVKVVKKLWEAYDEVNAFNEAKCADWYDELQSWLCLETDDIEPEIIDKANGIFGKLAKSSFSLNDEAQKILDDIVKRQDLQPEKDRPGYIYLLSGEGHYKIGRSIDAKKRSKQLAIQLPFVVELVHALKVKDMINAESALHTHFHEKRVNGEWFNLDMEDVEWFKAQGDGEHITELEHII